MTYYGMNSTFKEIGFIDIGNAPHQGYYSHFLSFAFSPLSTHPININYDRKYWPSFEPFVIVHSFWKLSVILIECNAKYIKIFFYILISVKYIFWKLNYAIEMLFRMEQSIFTTQKICVFPASIMKHHPLS